MFKEKKYSLSVEEDVYSFLERLSYIYENKDVNEDMFSAYYDFIRLMKKMSTNLHLKTYHDIQIGKIEKHETIKKIDLQCARRLDMELEEFNNGLQKEIEELVELNKEEWIKYINKKYKNVFFDEEFRKIEEQKKKEKEKDINDNTTQKKLKRTPRELTDKELANRDADLLPLIEHEKELERKIEELKKDGKEKTRECRRLVSLRIDIRKDINVIRRSYGEIIGNQNRGGRRSFTSYDSENPSFGHITIAHNDKDLEMKEDSARELTRVEMISKIREVAREVLTDRQFIIFELYYFNDITQQEIADLMGLKRNTVSEHIKRLEDRLRKYFQKHEH